MNIDDMNHVSAKQTAIRELLDTYHGAINFSDWAALEGVFTEDATWEALPPIGLRFEGRPAVLEGLKQSVGRQELLVQNSSGILIKFAVDGSASVRSTLSEFGKEKGTGKGWRAIAVYFDRVVQRDGSWRFQRRTLQLRYQGDSPAPGQVIESSPQTDG
jgi:ketosteroid isomerase-like protein